MGKFCGLSHTIWHGHYQIFWVTKYRFRILDGPINEVTYGGIHSICGYGGCEIVEMNVAKGSRLPHSDGPTESEVKKALGIPNGYTVDHIIPLGYADDEAEDKQPTFRTVKDRAGFRRKLGEVLHYERYDMGKYKTDTQVKEFIWSRTITRIPDP